MYVCFFIREFLALARTIQAKKRRAKNAGKPRPPRDLIQKKL
jgi:hypothetical protein